MNDDNDRFFKVNTPEEIAAYCQEQAAKEAEYRRRQELSRLPWLCRWLRGLTGDGAP